MSGNLRPPPVCSYPATPGHRLTQALQYQQAYRVLSFSMCISTRTGLFLCQYKFCIHLQTLNWAFFVKASSASQTGTWSVATESVYVKTAVLLGIFLFLLRIINSPNGTVKVYFIISLIKQILLDLMAEERDCLCSPRVLRIHVVLRQRYCR